MSRTVGPDHYRSTARGARRPQAGRGPSSREPGEVAECGDSGAGEIVGTITNSTINDNSVTVRSAAADASADAGAMIFLSGTLTGSTFNRNHLEADSPRGNVTVAGGAIATDGDVTMNSTTVNGNTIQAVGVSSTINHNAVSSSGVTTSGGGIFTNTTVDLTTSIVARNSPDQCVGCTANQAH